MPNVVPETAACSTRFLSDLTRILGRPPGDGERFGIAVSGGPDSMALLLLAHQALGQAVEAATVDHGLRPASAGEAATVATWCAGRGIVHATLRPTAPIAGSIQAAARTARYALLDHWRQERGLGWVLTAHHADDQLETLLMRLNRGSGVAGLAGIRARNGHILRPLLGWRRTALAAVAAGLPVIHDPSNVDPRYDRAALRRHLAHADWLDREAAAASSAALADAEAALAWMADQAYAMRATPSEKRIVLDCADLPREIRRRLLLRLVAAIDADAAPRGLTIDQALVELAAGNQVSIGNMLVSGVAGPDIWTAMRAPPRRNGS